MAVSGYRVLLMPAAQRDMHALEGILLTRIERAVLRLAEVPRPHGVKKLVGSENAYRMRAGSHRILYETTRGVW